MSFNAKLGYSDEQEVKNESDWKILKYAYNQTRPLTCRFTHLEKTDVSEEAGRSVMGHTSIEHNSWPFLNFFSQSFYDLFWGTNLDFSAKGLLK